MVYDTWSDTYEYNRDSDSCFIAGAYGEGRYIIKSGQLEIYFQDIDFTERRDSIKYLSSEGSQDSIYIKVIDTKTAEKLFGTYITPSSQKDNTIGGIIGIDNTTTLAKSDFQVNSFLFSYSG